jgi:Pyruvate/2-oxoacid:ferredoxin oxidoreductase delta subunit
MKIFYFSGTGNSFYTVKQIAHQFPQAELESISHFQSDSKVQICNEELIIVCPLYFYGIPHIVTNFLNRLVFDRCTYFSMVFTAEFPNGLAVANLKSICRRNNLRLDSCWYLKMPTNYLIKSVMLSADSITKVLTKADAKIRKIIKAISQRKAHIENDSYLYSLIVNAKKQYAYWQKAFLTFDEKFTTTDKCNGCKLCEKHCPARNIVFKETPVWKKRCEACLRCINICPQQAIEYGTTTSGRTRYFNPKVSLREFQEKH